MNVRRFPPRLRILASIVGAVVIAGAIIAAVSVEGGASTRQRDLALRVVNTSAGRMVVTGGGLTAYVYLPDQTHPSVTTCRGDCANDWPPVVVTGRVPAVEGIGKSRIGMVRRPDGTRQVTLNGYPMYRFAADRRPGDLRGESVGEMWFAIDPQGNFLPLAPVGFTPASRRAQQLIDAVSTAAGPVVADAAGQSLYIFKDDTTGSSACTAAWCVQDWPPFVAPRVPASVTGISAPLGALRRPDGTMQVTLAGHPLYRFSGDERPGDLRGLGIGGDWYPVAPDGSKVSGAEGIPGSG
jgi:predicted lipoprotein with Yx(FWY)xxD motif